MYTLILSLLLTFWILFNSFSVSAVHTRGQQEGSAGQNPLRNPISVYSRPLEHLPPPADADLVSIGVNDPHFIKMPIDHFTDKTKKTFNNRYWINATYFKSGGPVFLFDSGEQDAAPLLPYYLQEFHGLSAVMRLAKRYNGLAILWEHRFYGDSLPFPVNENTTADQWQFLNTEQALEDVVFFANSFRRSGHPSGESSADPLSSIRNPETIFASWASSAPVQAQVDMASYYKAAERSLTRNCSADWVAVTRYVDDTLKGGNDTAVVDMKFNLLKARLSGPGGNTTGADGLTRTKARSTSNLDAATILMDPLNFYQYYGFKASLLPFCNLLETSNFTKSALEGGIAASNGVEVAFKTFLTALAELDYDSIRGSPDDPVQDRSWMWQYCSEYGFYQRGDPENALSIETSFLSLELFQQQCNETFSQGLPSSPQVSNVNKYGGWNMNPSNVMFSNGEFDPWRTMGLASIESNSPMRKPSATIPRCNSTLPGSSVNPSPFFGITYENMVHVSDMRVLLVPDAKHSDFKTVGFYSPISQEPFFTGVGLFQMALDEWLPCFKPS